MSHISLSRAVDLVKEMLKNTYSGFSKRPSPKIVDSFAMDLALVACSIRTGYLLDSFFPENPVALFSRLLTDLRADPRSEDVFNNVFHVYEPGSEQSFFINACLLYSRVQPILSARTGYTTSPYKSSSVCVHLSSPLTIIDTPEDVQELLSFLLSQRNEVKVPLSCSFPNGTSVENAVPLAAFLLDYPVAYVPSIFHNGVLSGVPLDFYECSLSYERGNEDEDMVVKTIMKFSCPATLRQAPALHHELQPQMIIQSLNDMFLERLGDKKDLNLRISIAHTTQTLDSVTF